MFQAGVLQYVERFVGAPQEEQCQVELPKTDHNIVGAIAEGATDTSLVTAWGEVAMLVPR